MTSNRPVATILLVDDDPLITTLLGRQFPKQRFKVLTASSADEAYQLLDWHRVDVIVSDERMPGESGSEFLAAVRRKYPDTIRIIHTGQATLESAVRAINQAEVYRFFLKPCNPTDLMTTIAQALDHKRLEEHSRNMLRQFRKQTALLNALEQGAPGPLSLELDEAGGIAIEEGSDGDDLAEDLLREVEASVAVERRWLVRK
jgi:two-component system probable response regulator PhcQ